MYIDHELWHQSIKVSAKAVVIYVATRKHCLIVILYCTVIMLIKRMIPQEFQFWEFIDGSNLAQGRINFILGWSNVVQ